MKHPAVELVGVGFSHGRHAVLKDVTLRVAHGEHFLVTGPSGVGKSTLLRLIGGLERPAAGEIRLFGQVVATPKRSLAPEKRSVGFVFQDYALFPHLTVEQNVGFGLHRLGAEARRRRVAEALAPLGLEALAARFPAELSGGQQQRVALARALAPEPSVLLLDEPFSSLDPSLRAEVRAETVKVTREAGVTVLIVSHDQGDAESFPGPGLALG